MAQSFTTRGTLKEGEYHPAARDALAYIQSLSFQQRAMWQESFASVALSGNRLSEICSETLARLMEGKSVSDRYLLGLAWVIRIGENQKDEQRIPR